MILSLQTDPLTQNRYAFAGGNPISNIEWDGHVWACNSSCSANERRNLNRHMSAGLAQQAGSSPAADYSPSAGEGQTPSQRRPMRVAPQLLRTTPPEDRAKTAQEFFDSYIRPRENGTMEARYRRLLAVLGAEPACGESVSSEICGDPTLGEPADLQIAIEVALTGGASSVGREGGSRLLSWARGWFERSTATEVRTATSAAERRLLARQLASRQQMGEEGISIGGAGSTKPLRDAPRLTRTYGGSVDDWAKMRSSSRYSTNPEAPAPFDMFETHWYENVQSGARVEMKTKFNQTEGLLGG